MIPLWAVGALAGAAKSELVDRKKYENQVASRALEAKFAPMQGMASPSFRDIKAPDTAQTAIDWGLTGAAIGQQLKDPKVAAKAGAASSASEAASNVASSANESFEQLPLPSQGNPYEASFSQANNQLPMSSRFMDNTDSQANPYQALFNRTKSQPDNSANPYQAIFKRSN